MSNHHIFAVGSTNPVKVGSVASAVTLFWPEAQAIGVSTDSGVRAQPLSDEEMVTGALNRARQSLEVVATAGYGVGIEGGVLDGADGMWAYAWAVIIDREGRVGRGQTGRFLLPEPIAAMIRDGLELGEADDRFFGRANSKQQEGAVGILSDGRITRLQLYQPAVTFALFPFLRQEFYPMSSRQG